MLKYRKDDYMSKIIKVAFAFPSIHHSMEAEDLFTKAGLNPEFMQLPANLGMGCGTAVTVASKYEDSAKGILRQNRVPFLAVFSLGANGAWQKRKA